MSVLEDIAKERQRQIEVEGWTAEHDAGHPPGMLSKAAAGYADHAADVLVNGVDGANWDVPCDWPWADKWWKPKSPRRDLVRAAALIVAEIEKLDREGEDGPK